VEKIIISGPGNSGSGAIFDFLKDRSDIFLPFNEEFRLVNDPDGIQNLEENFYNNFSINNSAISFERFEKFCKHLSSFKNSSKELVYPENFEELYKEFISSLISVSYNGLPRFKRFNLSFKEKLNFYFNKIILNKKIKDLDLFRMIIPIEKNLFVQKSTNFINNIISRSSNFQKNKIALIDQGINIFRITENMKYFSNSKNILTIRDPRGTYYTTLQLKKKNISFAYQGLEINEFVKWYKFIYDKINKIENENKTLIVQFEKFVLDYKNVSLKILDFLQLENQKTKFDINKSLKNINDIENKIEKNSLNIIKSELKDFLLY
tara:strand:- start:2044 stop:3006 length:963 start_codon:yes stop_codon:yes gene_type:complete